MGAMKFIIVGKNIEVTEGLRTAVEDKIGKLEKYIQVTIIHSTCRMTLPQRICQYFLDLEILWTMSFEQ